MQEAEDLLASRIRVRRKIEEVPKVDIWKDCGVFLMVVVVPVRKSAQKGVGKDAGHLLLRESQGNVVILPHDRKRLLEDLRSLQDQGSNEGQYRIEEPVFEA